MADQIALSEDDIDLTALSDDDLVAQMHDDIYEHFYIYILYVLIYDINKKKCYLKIA